MHAHTKINHILYSNSHHPTIVSDGFTFLCNSNIFRANSISKATSSSDSVCGTQNVFVTVMEVASTLPETKNELELKDNWINKPRFYSKMAINKVVTVCFFLIRVGNTYISNFTKTC